MEKAVTEYKIDKITYVVEASSSQTATDTLKEKMNKLLLRDLSRKITKKHQ